MSSFPIKEFHMCMMGASNVGKTSLCERLHGKVFTRKPSKPSLEEEASKYSIEVKTSLGLLLFHLYDWAWEVKRREDSRAVNPQLMRGADGALFVYDVTDKGTLRCFGEFNDWYQRASGLLLLPFFFPSSSSSSSSFSSSSFFLSSFFFFFFFFFFFLSSFFFFLLPLDLRLAFKRIFSSLLFYHLILIRFRQALAYHCEQERHEEEGGAGLGGTGCGQGGRQKTVRSHFSRGRHGHR